VRVPTSTPAAITAMPLQHFRCNIPRRFILNFVDYVTAQTWEAKRAWLGKSINQDSRKTMAFTEASYI
jgi:hypothetical protein